MSTPLSLSARSEVIIEDFPYKWVPMLHFFDADVPGFPLHRIHIRRESERVFGVPVTRTVHEIDSSGTCTLGVDVVVNRSLADLSPALRDTFRAELEERLGFSEALSIDDILGCCQNPDGTTDERHEDWEQMVRLIFPRLERYFGSHLRCGRFYSRTYGLFRLVSTWNVLGGEKQEIIMTSNLLNTVGESVESEQGEAVNFHLVPTYEELLADDMAAFPKFRELKEAVEGFGDQHITQEYHCDGTTMLLLDSDTPVPRTAEAWSDVMSTVDAGSRELFVQLKEDLNRNWQRPFVLILYLYNVFQGLNFDEFSAEDYAEIFRSRPRTSYPKVLAMILQQAFGNYKCMPVDRWMTEFFETLLDTPENEIPLSGTDMGKFERFVWETAQLRKTNQPLFNDIVHCIKTGILYSEEKQMRNPNPLSCKLCSLSDENCPTYCEISDSRVAVVERDRFDTADGPGKIEFTTPARKISDDHGELYLDVNEFEFGELPAIDFVIITISGEALASYSPTRQNRQRWERTDDMSAFTTHVLLEEGVKPVTEIVGTT